MNKLITSFILVLIMLSMISSHLKLEQVQALEREQELWLNEHAVIGWMVRTETPYYEFVPRTK
jgi:hypothetical protein